MRRAIALSVRGLLGLTIVMGIPRLDTRAATDTWTGNGADNNWSDGVNWSSTPNPPPNDGTADIHFAGAQRLTPSTDVTFAIHSITFDNSASSFVNSGLQLTIGSTGTGGVTNLSTNLQTINNAIVLNANQTFAATTGDLTFGGTVNLNGNVLTFDGGPNSTINMNAAISGTGSIHLLGDSETAIFAANNNYNGTTTIDAGGTLQVGNGGSTGSLGTGNVTVNGALLFDRTGTLTVAANILGTNTGTVEVSGGGTVIYTGTGNAYAGTTTIDAGNTLQLGNGGANGSIGTGAVIDTGTFAFDSSGALTIAGAISGTGSVQQTGAGTTTLNVANSYTGGTTVNAGTLAAGVGATGAFVNNTAYTINGGTLDMTNNGALTMSSLSGTGGTINNGSNKLTVNNSTSNQTYGGVITGSGAFETDGTNTLTLSGTNTYTGATTIGSGATLQIGNGGTTGSIDGTTGVANNGTLIYNRSNATTINYVIADGTSSGAVTDNGTGTLIFNSNNTYTGATTINSGSTLQLGSGGTAGSINSGSAVTDNGTLAFDRSDAVTFSNVITGSGGVTQAGPNTVTLTGANNYTGTTTINIGSTLQVGDGVSTTASLGTGPVVDNGTLTFDNVSNLTQSGAISGTGALTKIGAGNLTLSGLNTYSGGTTVTTGTLTGTTDSLQGAITNNAAVVFDQDTDGTYAGIMGGTGTLAKNGAGNVTFTAANTYTGDTTIAAGTLTIAAGGGSITSNTTVAAGGTLDVEGTITGTVMNNGTALGSGTVSSTFTNAGTLTPGVVGTKMTVGGQFTNTTAGSVNITVDPTDTSGIHANTAEIDGGTLNVDTTNAVLNHKYVFLTTDAGFMGTTDFDQVNPSSGMNFVLATTGRENNNMDEFFILQSNFISAAQTQNERAVARYLDAIAADASGDLSTVINDLQGLTPEQAAAALESMTGDIHATLGQLDIQGSTLSIQRIAKHLRGGAFAPDGAPLVAGDDRAQKPGLGAPVQLVCCNEDGTPELAGGGCDTCVNWTGWVQGFGLGGNARSDGNAPGVNYNMGGTIAGLERWVDDCHLLGFYAGYTGINVPTAVSQISSVNGGQVGGYFMADDGFSYYAIIGGFQFDRFDVHRGITFTGTDQTASSDSTGWQTVWYAERGFSFRGCNQLLQPFVGLQYDYLRQDGFAENGAGAIDLQGNAESTESLRSILGARAQMAIFSRCGRRFLPELHAMWIHEYIDSNTQLNAHFIPIPTGSPGFSVQGLDFGRDWALAGTTFTWEMSDGCSMFVSYDCQANTQQVAHIGSGGIGFSW